jgi:DNA-binding NarL/FixJ family response regulator
VIDRDGRAINLLEMSVSEDPDTEEAADFNVAVHRLRSVLGPRQQAVLSLRLEGLNNTDIARELRMRRAAVVACMKDIQNTAARILGVHFLGSCASS